MDETSECSNDEEETKMEKVMNKYKIGGAQNINFKLRKLLNCEITENCRKMYNLIIIKFWL